ncbi:hypothetical protein BJV77DRAFT_987685 [Russula vinacea]|nr:hypothetical protein BJV77DRAFT_987685 [Russula vinacea]
MPTIDQRELGICAEQQSEEWEVLSVSSTPQQAPSSCDSCELACPMDILVTGTGDAEEQEYHLSLSSLPPVLLDIVLPPAYPCVQPLKLFLFMCRALGSHWWFLSEKLLGIWQPGEGGDFLDAMGIMRDGVLRIPHAAPQLLLPFLTAYESKSQSSKFNLASHPCNVCFETVKGSRCLQFICGHIFCRACLRDGWSLYIAEGDVVRVGCLDPQCVKDEQEATEDEVRMVVTEEEVHRWKWLREKKLRREAHPSIVLCPMVLCQKPVPKPSGQDDTGWERLRTCPLARHGPLSDCPIQIAEKLMIEYMGSMKDSAIRKTMERRYGKKNLERLVTKYEEDRANRAWLEKSTMSCPSCHVHVEKSMGCNHMTCTKCKQHFCYRCGTKLQASNPYEHFSRLGGGCYSKLFDVTEMGWDGPMEGFVWV